MSGPNQLIRNVITRYGDAVTQNPVLRKRMRIIHATGLNCFSSHQSDCGRGWTSHAGRTPAHAVR